jgi:hypothetical protein
LAAWVVFCPGEAAAQSEAAFPGWNVGYSLPPTWFVRQTVGRLHVLGSDSEAGGVFLAPGLYEDFDDVRADLEVLAQLAQLIGAPVEGPTDTMIAGSPGVVAVYAAQSRSGERLRARLLATFSPYGTGVVALGMVKPDQFWYFQQTLDRIVASVRIGKPDIQESSVAAAAGTWAAYRAGKPPPVVSADDWSGVKDVFEFDGQGLYAWKSAIYLSAEVRGKADDPALIRDETDAGAYTVIAGRLILKGRRGQRAMDLSIEDGRMVVGTTTYFRRP